MAAVSTSQAAGRMSLVQPTRALRCNAGSRVFGVAPLPPRCLPAIRCVAQAQQSSSSPASLQESITRAAAWSTAAATLLAAGNAQAASEVAQLAASDNRFGIIAVLFLPVIGWAGLNIGGPALNQLSSMGPQKGGKVRARSAAAGLGLGAALLLASQQQADAAQEVAQLAAGDNRVFVIATLFLPVVGWVLFNIGGPALNQLQNISNKPKGGAVKKAQKAVSKATKRRAVAGAIAGLSAASLLAAAPQADAAQELAQLAASDNRFGIIATLFLPVIGWVAFNIGGPALNQLQNTGKLAGAAGKVGRKSR